VWDFADPSIVMIDRRTSHGRWSHATIFYNFKKRGCAKKKYEARCSRLWRLFGWVLTFFKKNTEHVSAFFASILCFCSITTLQNHFLSRFLGYKIGEKKGKKRGRTMVREGCFLFFTRKKVGAIDNQ
jgi:hypothetical protein